MTYVIKSAIRDLEVRTILNSILLVWIMTITIHGFLFTRLLISGVTSCASDCLAKPVIGAVIRTPGSPRAHQSFFEHCGEFFIELHSLAFAAFASAFALACSWLSALAATCAASTFATALHVALVRAVAGLKTNLALMDEVPFVPVAAVPGGRPAARPRLEIRAHLSTPDGC